MLGVLLGGFATWGLRVSVTAPILAAAAIVVFRFGLLDYSLPLLGLAGALLLSVLALSLCVVTLLLSFVIGGGGDNLWHVQRALIGVVVSLVVLYAPAMTLRQGWGAPPIHDISTDLENPPMFRVVPSKRTAGNNSLEIDAEVQAKQKAHYTDIAPLYLGGGTSENFGHARTAAENMGWEIVSVDEERGEIEATATTPLLAFKDDVIVRLTADGETRTRIDMRSASRIGVSDLGANAARIEEYFEELREMRAP